MKNDLTYKYGIDNIFDFSFMEDFTTVILAKEEYEIDISKLDFKLISTISGICCCKNGKKILSVALAKKQSLT